MSNTTVVQRADAGDGAILAGVIAEAFDELSVCHWLVPDATTRRRLMPEYFRIFVEIGLEHGLVHTTPERDAVIIWFPNDREPMPWPADYDEQLQKATWDNIERFRHLDAVMGLTHPHAPHHHLAFLAVRPHLQSRGVGAALMQHHLSYLDEHGIPAYLEAANLRSRAMYVRHGFVTHGEPLLFTEDADPVAGPSMWPLWREPAPRG
jgi:GNAT superfamily N-acetyltransferase